MNKILKTTLALAGFLTVVSGVRAQGGTVAPNMAGFVNIMCPSGATIVGDPFLGFTASNTVASVLPNTSGALNGDEIISYSGTSGYTILVGAPSGWRGNASAITLTPGRAVIFRNEEAATLSFSGIVPQGSLINTLQPGYNLASSILPQSGGLSTMLGLPEANGNVVALEFSPTSQTPTDFYTNDISSTPPWDVQGGGHAEPSLAVGLGCWYINNGATVAWPQSFQVPANVFQITNFSYNGSVSLAGMGAQAAQSCMLFASASVMGPWTAVGTNTSAAGGNFSFAVSNVAAAQQFYLVAATAPAGPPVQSPPVLTWANPPAITYGTILDTNQLNATANTAGTFNYDPSPGTVLMAGTNTLSTVFTPTDTTDFTSATNAVSIVVLPAPLIVTASNISKIYGQTIAFSGTEFSVAGLVNGDIVTNASISSAGADPTAAVSGSPYAIDITNALGGDGLTNYIITYVNGALAVNLAALTITPINESKTYGQTVTFAGTEFTASGLVNSETVGSVTLTSAGTAATAPVAGSPYGIAASGATGGTFSPGNYTITYAGGTLTVIPATLTITANNGSKTYGQTVTFAGTEFTASGLVNSETVGSVTLTSTGTAATAPVAGSPYGIAAITATGGTFSPGNYTIIYAGGTLTVIPATLTITANNLTKTYGQTVTFAGTEFVAAGLLNGDTVTSVTLTSSGAAASATVAGSPYAIVPTAAVGSGLSNYTITYANGTLTVSGATLIVTWTNPGPIIYGETLTSNQLNATANGAGSFTYDPTNGSVLNAGTNTLSVVFDPTDMADYSDSTNTVSLVVSNAPLTVTAANANRAFGQPNPVFTGAITGLTNGDNITAIYTCTAASNSPAGMYSIVPSLVDPDNRQTNYSVTLVNGTLTVTGGIAANFSSLSLGGSVLQIVLTAGAGENYALDRSSNLVTWLPLTTNTVTVSGTINFTDTPGTNNAKSTFYRARLVP